MKNKIIKFLILYVFFLICLVGIARAEKPIDCRKDNTQLGCADYKKFEQEVRGTQAQGEQQVISVIGSGPLPYLPHIPYETALNWYTTVILDCGVQGIAHYEASIFTIAQQEAAKTDAEQRLAAVEVALEECLLPPPPPPPPLCATGNDGPGGFLWKPKAESNIGAVLLMPDEYCGQDIGVEGAVVVRTVCGPNGNRMHWFLDKPGWNLPSPLQINFSGGNCLLIDNPSVRND